MKRERSDSRNEPRRREGAASSARKKAAAPRPAAKKAARKAAPRKPAAPGPEATAAPGRKATARAAQAETKPAPAIARARKTTPPPAMKAPPATSRPKAAQATRPKPEKVAAPAPRRPAARAAAPRTPRAKPASAEADSADEQRIESAKYTTGEQGQPRRVFEEEKFIFPETYGRNRVRLLVKDPQWIFAHWDVDPSVFAGLRSELGERAAALSRLTLKVSDPEHGGGAVIHLPEDARSWYLRADRVRRAYTAELGLTLPDGSYRVLATSNRVRTPQGSASPRHAGRRARYIGPRPHPEGGTVDPQYLLAAGESRAAGEGAPGRKGEGLGPWKPMLAESGPHGARGAPAGEESSAPGKGGASDVHRR
jgi:hypothetical protein